MLFVPNFECVHKHFPLHWYSRSPQLRGLPPCSNFSVLKRPREPCTSPQELRGACGHLCVVQGALKAPRDLLAGEKNRLAPALSSSSPSTGETGECRLQQKPQDRAQRVRQFKNSRAFKEGPPKKCSPTTVQVVLCAASHTGAQGLQLLLVAGQVSIQVLAGRELESAEAQLRRAGVCQTEKETEVASRVASGMHAPHSPIGWLDGTRPPPPPCQLQLEDQPRHGLTLQRQGGCSGGGAITVIAAVSTGVSPACSQPGRRQGARSQGQSPLRGLAGSALLAPAAAPVLAQHRTGGSAGGRARFPGGLRAGGRRRAREDRGGALGRRGGPRRRAPSPRAFAARGACRERQREPVGGRAGGLRVLHDQARRRRRRQASLRGAPARLHPGGVGRGRARGAGKTERGRARRAAPRPATRRPRRRPRPPTSARSPPGRTVARRRGARPRPAEGAWPAELVSRGLQEVALGSGGPELRAPGAAGLHCTALGPLQGCRRPPTAILAWLNLALPGGLPWMLAGSCWAPVPPPLFALDGLRIRPSARRCSSDVGATSAQFSTGEAVAFRGLRNETLFFQDTSYILTPCPG